MWMLYRGTHEQILGDREPSCEDAATAITLLEPSPWGPPPRRLRFGSWNEGEQARGGGMEGGEREGGGGVCTG